MDSLLRNEYPSSIEVPLLHIYIYIFILSFNLQRHVFQLIAAIPITFSFIGAIILENESTGNKAMKSSMDSSIEQESLIHNQHF